KITAMTMMGTKFIDQSLETGVQKILLFHAVSDRLLFLRDKQVQSQLEYQGKTIDDDIPISMIEQVRCSMLEKTLKHLEYARDRGLEVYFGAEDASRADFDFLTQCISKFEPYVELFVLADTVGCLTPEKTHFWLSNLLEVTNGAALGVHFHNDMGLALENTLQAIHAGAIAVSGTFSGIGERAGNAPLEQVLDGLRMRWGWEVEGINYSALEAVTEALARLGVRANPPYSPGTHRQETGIHLHSLLCDRHSYTIFPDQEPEIWFGKCSGASNFKYLFERHLNQSLPQQYYEQLRTSLKELSIQEQRSYSTSEVLSLIEQDLLPMFPQMDNGVADSQCLEDPNLIRFRVEQISQMSKAMLNGLLEVFNQFGCIIIACDGVSNFRQNLLDIGSHFGQIMPHRISDDDGIVTVTPTPGAKYTALTGQPFDFHTDGSFMPVPPKVVALQCIVAADTGGESQVVQAETLYNFLKEQDPIGLPALFEPDAVVTTTVDGEVYRGPVFVRADNRVMLTYRPSDHQVTVQAKPKVAQAYNLIQGYLENGADELQYKLQPGEILIMDNTRILHTRKPFKENQGAKRKFHRLWLDGKPDHHKLAHNQLKFGFSISG
ncbi:TauD/TfdA family dioxygenase, partial [Moorena sp. SIO3I8]|uniref:TauD/TfdA family dioxygenase n=1 Tax=Moorena sp. SIO3I8 TaxID=2607833 RepID=UPI0013C24F36